MNSLEVINNSVDIFDVVNLILVRNPSSTTHLKLQKLLYFVFAVYYFEVGQHKENDKLLFNELPEAWIYGPVFPTVYNKYRYNLKSLNIDRSRINIFDTSINENHICHNSINKVVESLGHLKEGKLIGLTHREGSAWAKTYKTNVMHNTIQLEDILKEMKMYAVKSN